MTIDLLLAPPASGKTAICIERILAVHKEQPLAQVWVLVPNSQKAAYFKSRLAAAGGGMGVRVGMFRYFYKEILEENGVFVPIISPALSHRLIQETVRDSYSAGELNHYAAIKDKPGFLLVLRDAFAELRSALVQPSAFLEYTHGSTPARHELAILYNRFLAHLDTLGWVDGEGQAWQAIKALQANPNHASRPSLVIADGFTSFTPAQKQFLRQLGERTGELLMTLTGEMNSDRQVDGLSLDVLEDLQRDLAPEIHEIKGEPRLPAAILHMQRHVLNPGEVEKLDALKPIMLEARSQSDEAREALRWIKELNVRQNIPLNACAIYTANFDIYQPLLRSAADEFGIRIHFSRPDPLSESPAVLALLSLLELPLENYPTRLLLNTLRSPYFNFDLAARDLEDLEIVSQQAIIVNGKDQWNDAWSMFQELNASETEYLDEERRRKNRTAGIDLNALRARLDDFWNLYSDIETKRSQTDWIRWLEKRLDQLDFYQRISSEHDREACASLGEALRALLLSESVVGERMVDYAQFLADLKGTLAGARLDEPRKSSGNAVFVGKMVEARGARYEAVVLMGLSEGLFPVVENPDPFLDEELRKDLGLEPRLGRQQASTFYQVFTRADSYLLLTRPYLSEEGESWEPSLYWDSAIKLFSNSAIFTVQPSLPRPQSEAASVQELLFWAMQQQKLHYSKDELLLERWQRLQKTFRILDSRRSKVAQGMFGGNLSPLSDKLTSKFSGGYVWSASRLETYKACPFRFLVGVVLKLEPKKPPEFGLNISQKGNIYHRVLELVYKRAGLEGVSPMDLLDEVASGVFAKAPSKEGFRPSALWEVEKAELLEKLRVTLDALERERDQWKPLAYEKKFGIGGAPHLCLDIAGNVVKFRGQIDRIDINPEGNLRVIDYKSGSSHLSKNDLLDGLRLQLPIYALAVQEALLLGEVEEGFYWAINDAKASSFKLSNFIHEGIEGPNAAYQVTYTHVQTVLEGTHAGKFEPKAPKDGCPEYCPAIAWCWRYKAGYKND